MALRIKVVMYESIGSSTPNYKSVAKIWVYDQNGNKVTLDYTNVIRHNCVNRTSSSYINEWFNDNINSAPPYGSNDAVGLVEIQLPESVTSVSSVELWSWANTGGAGKALVYLSDNDGFDYHLKAKYTFSVPSEQVAKPLDGSGFETIKVGGKTLGFVKVLYVDPVSGDDAGAGTFDSPLRTISAAVSMCEDAGYAIYALEGTHNVTHVSSAGNGTGGLYDAGKSISFIGVPGHTVFLCDGVANNRRDHHAVSTYGSDTKAYQLVFDVKLNGRTASYAVAVFGRDSFFTKCKVYNCVFVYDGVPSIIYDNNISSVIEVYNSAFITTGNFPPSYSGGGQPKLTNCVSNFSFYNEGAMVTCANNLSFDSMYRITSDINLWKNVGTGLDLDGSAADLGVYGGIYSWYKDLEVVILSPDVKVPKNTDAAFSYKIYAPQPADVSEVMQMTKYPLGEGSLFVSDDIDLRLWTKIRRLGVN
jgi:hypothetical protein